MGRLILSRNSLFDRRVIFKISSFALVVFLFWFIFSPNTKKAKQCFEPNVSIDQAALITYFPKLKQSYRQPTPGKSIFFHETSCGGDGFVRLTAR